MTLTLDAHQHLATPETQFGACSCSQEFPFLNGKLQSHSTTTSVCRCMDEPYHWVFGVGYQSIHSQAEIRLPVLSLLLCMWQLFFMRPFPLAVLVLTVCSTSDSDLPGFCQVNLPAHGWCSVLFLQFAWTVPVPWIACLIQIYLCRQRLGISLFSGHLWNYRQDTASHQSTPTNSWGTCIRFSCVLGWNTNLQPLTSVSNPVLALLQSQLIPKMGARSLRSCQMLFIILNKNKICISIILIYDP